MEDDLGLNLEIKIEIAVVKVRLIELYAERDFLNSHIKRLITADDEKTHLAIVLNTLSRLEVYLYTLKNPSDPR